MIWKKKNLSSQVYLKKYSSQLHRIQLITDRMSSIKMFMFNLLFDMYEQSHPLACM